MSAVAVTFTFVDAKGKSSNTKVHLPTGFSLNQYASWAQAFGQILANLTNGQITEIGVSIPLDISAISNVMSTLADVAEKALVNVRSSVAGLFSRFNIPTFNNTLVVTGSDALDDSDPAVSDFYAMIEEGVDLSPGVYLFQDMRGNPLATVTNGRKTFLERS